WLQNVSDEEVIAAYRHAEYFMLLGKDEGFGLPFVEALASGCQVIAMDQPLTRELLGEACTYVEDSIESDASVLRKKPDVPGEIRQRVVSKFDWEHFSRGVRDRLFADITGVPGSSW